MIAGTVTFSHGGKMANWHSRAIPMAPKPAGSPAIEFVNYHWILKPKILFLFFLFKFKTAFFPTIKKTHLSFL